MIPVSKGARVTFYVVLIAAVALLLVSTGATIWSQVGSEGWVGKAVVALMSWVISVPVVLTALVWSIVLFVRSRRNSPSAMPATQR